MSIEEKAVSELTWTKYMNYVFKEALSNNNQELASGVPKAM